MLLVVEEHGAEQFYVICLDTAISGPRLIRAWQRRHWIEHCFRRRAGVDEVLQVLPWRRCNWRIAQPPCSALAS